MSILIAKWLSALFPLTSSLKKSKQNGSQAVALESPNH